MAAAYMGLALALFSNLHAPYSAKLANYSEYGVVLGLAAACVGICWCSWLMLIGP
jgi:hypothetical protein